MDAKKSHLSDTNPTPAAVRLSKPDLHGWLSEFAPAQPPLLWAHVTKVAYLLDMMQAGAVTPFPCRFFKKKLVYMFYGRPAYRDGDEAAIGETVRAPALILFKNTVEKYVHDVWPFDSGAFHNKRYRHWDLPHYNIERYSLKSDPETGRRYVTAFFGGNEEYFQAKAIRRTDTGLVPEAAIINGMLCDRTNKTADYRRFVVEMNTEVAVPFSNEYVQTVLVPLDIKDDLDREGYPRKSGISVIAYDCLTLNSPGDYQTIFESIAKIEQKGVRCD
jgi:hypothetical protein